MENKLVHLIGQLVRGGAEKQLLRVSQQLALRGWVQTVVTFNPGDVWEEKFRECGIPVLQVPRRASKLSRLWDLRRIIRDERPSLIHSWSHHTSVYARWLIGCGKPIRIFSFRSNPLVDSFSGKPIERVRNASIYEAADCVISNSQASLESAEAAGVSIRRAEVVGNIVSAPGRANPGEKTAVPKIVAAGALTPIKAYDVLLKAAAILADENHAFELVIAGVGPEEENLKRLKEELNLNGRVTFLGGVDDVPALLSKAHLMVHSSHCEGLSNSILEAMSEGLPVVVTRVGGTPEIVADYRQLVPPDDPVSLAARMKPLLTSPELRREIGQANLTVIQRKCDPSLVATQYEEIYYSLLQDHKSAERLPVNRKSVTRRAW